MQTRKKILYVGLNLPPSNSEVEYVHYPLISCRPMDANKEIQEAFSKLKIATHIIFTSKTTVGFFKEYLLDQKLLLDKECISIGSATTSAIQKHLSCKTIHTAKDATLEGVIEYLKQNVSPEKSYLFWAHSKGSRDVLFHFLENEGYKIASCALYETVFTRPSYGIGLDAIDAIFFSSPSTIDAYIHFFKELPKDKKLLCQGPITEKHLEKVLSR